MSAPSPEQSTVFTRAHADLPRQAPGSRATTEMLLRLADSSLPPAPRILDIGCGPGASTVPLAELTGGAVTAVDVHRPFLDAVERRAADAGVAERVTVLRARMEELPVAPGSIDLIWAEGSAYLMGFDDALAAWRGLLAAEGVLVLTEAEYVTDDPSDGARAFWAEAYPAMRSTAENVAACQRAGWDVLGTYLLPSSDWLEYYGPLHLRVEELRAEGVDEALLAPIVEEIRVRQLYGRDYGYTGYVLRPRQLAVGGSSYGVG
ncbi:MAG: methyltransferase domain-containing protein [Gordonia sp. (in: high G+C Gram-positive bacteria)]|uniref:SAM-dependent methyltransferase n=1 Tax=Gordonia sp. (in: high G+C Gram-positive bacteria) TaxID=84139 RepID=UPI0039E48C9C